MKAIGKSSKSVALAGGVGSDEDAGDAGGRRSRVTRASAKGGSLRHSVILPTGVLVIACIYFALPIYWLVISSLKDTRQLLGTDGFLPPLHVALLNNIEHVFSYQNHAYAYWLGDTILYSIVGGAGATVIAAAAGYAFAEYDFRGKAMLFYLGIAGVLLPPTAVAIPLYLLFSRIHLINTPWAVFIPALISPLGFYLARVYAASGVSRELIDSARIDGAGEVAIFVRIGLPLMRPALVTIFLFSFVSISNNFFLPLIMLNNPRLFPVTLGLYMWNSSIGSTATPRFVQAAVVTGALIVVVPVVVAFALLRKWWSRAIALGALKG